MLVTVVMPSLNQAPFIDDAIASVLGQGHENVELVVVDGLSTDGTLEKLERWQTRAKGRMRWVSAKDTGPAQAVNTALRMAQGEVIGWLNSDDGYAQGAVSRAVAHFEAHADAQMVYGRAHHVNEHGADLGSYPTQPPPASIDTFAKGSFICQPSAFIRRAALQEIGLLDENLRVAFDFEWWLRFFKRYPGQIGFVRQVQAYSRLHDACLTRKQRRTVAAEGMQVLARHLGSAPAHWALTHFDEMCAAYPYSGEPANLRQQTQGFLQQIRSTLTPEDLAVLIKQLESDARLRLAIPQGCVSVTPDGWVQGAVVARLRWQKGEGRTLCLRCRGAWPLPGKIRLKITTPIGHVQRLSVDAEKPFVLQLQAPEGAETGYASWVIETRQHFVSAQHEAGSTDHRKLSFRIEELFVTL